jgi:hypothetical protein
MLSLFFIHIIFDLFLVTYCIYGKNVLSLYQEKLITIKTIKDYDICS